MREFFRGWRRKTGVITLVMATALWCGWMGSYSIADNISWCVSDNTMDMFMSAECNLTWQTTRNMRGVAGYPRWSSSVLDPRVTTEDPDEQYTVWHFRCLGIEAGDCNFPDAPGGSFAFCTFPYWSIVIPLTLLSAYLILWKPRKRVKHDA
jgi:hypothetical protein